MPLEQEAPQLDTRTYDQLRRTLLARIPRYLPEWTDYNATDPGIALVELFSFLGDNLLYRLNRAPEAAKLAFLHRRQHRLRFVAEIRKRLRARRQRLRLQNSAARQHRRQWLHQ